ncbi:uncharacterized protein G2W53_027319 [Senna tora]|uniref:Uncharacterized protein n=1 Tax=Senna tora TaxID=362788 RepID=A0A834TQM7_9FABA|nr:uncharacterized protein G2W53_027319 [Senna tora]
MACLVDGIYGREWVWVGKPMIGRGTKATFSVLCTQYFTSNLTFLKIILCLVDESLTLSFFAATLRSVVSFSRTALTLSSLVLNLWVFDLCLESWNGVCVGGELEARGVGGSGSVASEEEEEDEATLTHLRNLWLPHFKQGKEKLWSRFDLSGSVAMTMKMSYFASIILHRSLFSFSISVLRGRRWTSDCLKM